MAEVRFERVRKLFGRIVAVDDVSLEIPDGAFVILVGPSGCGKTTLLRLLAGLEEVSGGRIMIGGRDVTALHPRERDIAMVFQSYALYPHMSVRRNMSFAMELKKAPAAEVRRRIATASEILGIGDLLDRRPKELSGGQRQRVALGRAMVREPAVFLFDEPLSNLDAKLRTSMRGELIKLHRRLKSTIVYVTHDQVEAMTMGEIVVVMRDGRVQQQGTPMEIYQDPCNVFVAEFIGSPAMNLLAGSIAEGGGEAVLGGGDLRLPLPPLFRTEGKAPSKDGLVFGLRPEHIEIAPESPGQRPDSAFDGRVEVVEPLGAEAIIEIKVGRLSLTARVRGGDLPPIGVSVRCLVDARHVYVFDRQTGNRIASLSGAKT